MPAPSSGGRGKQPHGEENWGTDRRLAPIRWIITAVALALLAVEVLAPENWRLSAVALGFLGLAALPWLSSILESASLPGGWELKFREVEREQARQRYDLDRVLRFLMENFLSENELVQLEKIASEGPFPFEKSEAFESELRRLLSLGLIRRRPGRGIRTLFRVHDDVLNHLEITERGREYLRYRRELDTDG